MALEGPATQEDAQQAQRLSQWLEGIDPTARQIIDQAFQANNDVMQQVLKDVLQVDIASFGIAPSGETLTEYFQRLAPVGTGPQLYVSSAPYADPPVPDPGAPFEVVFDITNNGERPAPASKARVRIDGIDAVDVDVPEVEPGGTTTVRVRMTAGRATGEFNGTAFAAYDGSEEPSGVPGPAGVVYGYPFSVVVGEAAQGQYDQAAISAVPQAMSYLQQAVTAWSGGQVDVSNVAWSLQNLGPAVADDVAGELDSLAAQVEGTNPDTVMNMEAVAEAVRAAASKLYEVEMAQQQGQTRETVDAVLAQAVEAMKAMANTILNR